VTDLSVGSDCGSLAINCGHFTRKTSFQIPGFKLFDWGEEITVSFWAKSDFATFSNYLPLINNGYTANKYGGAPTFQMEITFSQKYGDYIDYFIATQQGQNLFHFTRSKTIFLITTWNHFAMTFKSGSRVDYLNGEALGNPTVYTDSFLRTRNIGVYVGSTIKGHNFGYMDGYMADIRIYNRSLDANEIRNVVINPNRNDCDNGLISWYEFKTPGTDSCDYQYATFKTAEDPITSNNFWSSPGGITLIVFICIIGGILVCGPIQFFIRK